MRSYFIEKMNIQKQTVNQWIESLRNKGLMIRDIVELDENKLEKEKQIEKTLIQALKKYISENYRQ